MLMYRILFAFNTLVTLLCGFYLVTGLQYDAGGDDMAIWLPILFILIAGLVGAWVLRAKGRHGLAVLLLAAIAILPAGLIGFYGLLLATGGSWK